MAHGSTDGLRHLVQNVPDWAPTKPDLAKTELDLAQSEPSLALDKTRWPTVSFQD